MHILIEKGINVNYRNDGWSALLLLSRYYSHTNLIEIIQMLVNKNVDVNFQHENGWNALPILFQYYEHENLIDIIQILIDNNINIHSKNEKRKNSLLLLLHTLQKQKFDCNCKSFNRERDRHSL